MSEIIPTVTITRELSHDFLAGIIITAVEGGINYWAEVSEYDPSGWDSDSPESVTAKVQEYTDDDEVSEKAHTLDTLVVARGIERIMSGPVYVATWIQEYIWNGIAGDPGAIDAIAADAIVQAGLLNELRYG